MFEKGYPVFLNNRAAEVVLILSLRFPHRFIAYVDFAVFITELFMKTICKNEFCFFSFLRGASEKGFRIKHTSLIKMMIQLNKSFFHA